MCSFSVCRRVALARKELTGGGKNDFKGQKQENRTQNVYAFQYTES